MIELHAGGTALAIDPDRGGRWCSLTVDAGELLVGPPDPTDRSFSWGCFLMAPWAGRIAGAVLDWDGVRHRLQPNDGPNAIHGVVYGRPWSVERVTPSEAVLSCRLEGGDWPFGGLVRQRVRLSPDGLVAEAEVVAERSMPASFGWHPWFRMGGGARVRVAGDEVLETRDLIPTGRRHPVDAITDLRAGPAVDGRALDHVYPDVASPAVIRWADRELEIASDGPLRTIVVHTRPESFCVEPQTAWPNAPALADRGVPGTGLARLEPGSSLRAAMTWRWQTGPTERTAEL